MTQPALSYQIKQLEQRLDTSLFHRRPGGVSLTEAGRVLFQHVQKITETINHAERAISELSEDIVGEVFVGTINSVGMFFLPSVLRSMRTNYPKVRINVLFRSDSNELVETLRQNRIDLAIVASPRRNHRLAYDTLLDEQISLVCGSSYPFFGKKVVKASKLEGVPFVSISKDLTTGAAVQDYFEKVEVNVKSVISTDNVEFAKKMVEAGLGVSLLPDMFLSQDFFKMGKPASRLSRSVLEPKLSRRITLVTWKGCSLSRAGTAFVSELENFALEWKNYMSSDGTVPLSSRWISQDAKQASLVSGGKKAVSPDKSEACQTLPPIKKRDSRSKGRSRATQRSRRQA